MKSAFWPFGPKAKVQSFHFCSVYTSIQIYPTTYLFNPYQNKLWFLRVCSTTLLKIQWEKEKLLVTSNFSFSHNVFYLFGELSAIFIKFEIFVCKFFRFGSFKIYCFMKGLRDRLALSGYAKNSLKAKNVHPCQLITQSEMVPHFFVNALNALHNLYG